MTRTVRVAFYATIVAFSCLYVGWLSWTEQHEDVKRQGGGQTAPDTDSPLARSALADGCYHIYIDGGANIGVHGRFLLEPEKYPDAKKVAEVFDSEFGPPGERDNRDFCVFEIEANPTHLATLTEKENAYKAMGWRYHAINAGISDKGGSMSFYRKNDEVHEEWGFSVKKFFDGVEEVSIPMIRLSSWIADNVLSRKMPETVHGNYENGPKIVMKLDIEGSEYVTLPDLISSGVLCQLDFVFMEFHSRNAPFEGYFPGLDVPLGNKQQALAFETGLVDTVKSFSRTCKVRLIRMDDESYLHDGAPLPTVDSVSP